MTVHIVIAGMSESKNVVGYTINEEDAIRAAGICSGSVVSGKRLIVPRNDKQAYVVSRDKYGKITIQLCAQSVTYKAMQNIVETRGHGLERNFEHVFFTFASNAAEALTQFLSEIDEEELGEK